MRDPYLYKDCDILKNKLNIKEQDLLNDAEADYVTFRLKDLALNPLKGDYHTDHFLAMHKYIFQDIFDWAGEPRTIAIYKEEGILQGQSVEYSDPFDIVRDIHFVLQDMRHKSWKNFGHQKLTEEFCDSLARLWKIHPFREGNVRTALVAYNAFFSDGADFSKKEYFQRIVYDALRE